MKASLLILLLASLALLSYAQIAGAVNEAPPTPPPEEDNPDAAAEGETPMADAGGLVVPTIDTRAQTIAAPTRRNPSPVSFESCPNNLNSIVNGASLTNRS